MAKNIQASWNDSEGDCREIGMSTTMTDEGPIADEDLDEFLGIYRPGSTQPRPQVRKLMDDGRLDHRKVGTHHRITVVSIQAFLAAERDRRRPILAELARLQNDAGLVE